MVGMVAVDHSPEGCATKPLLPLLPVHPTPPRTELTPFKKGVGLFDALRKLPLPFQFFIGWNPMPSFREAGVP